MEKQFAEQIEMVKDDYIQILSEIKVLRAIVLEKEKHLSTLDFFLETISLETVTLKK